MSDYTLKQLQSIKCDCGASVWQRSTQSTARIFCTDCGAQSPRKPEVTKSRVKSDFRYARLIMQQATAELDSIGRNDDPRLGAELDIDTLVEMANELNAVVSTFAEYVSERGGQL